jgi:mono/diheme cytochrome c family protein
MAVMAQSYVFRDDSPLYTEFLDPNFPFLEATVDLRGIAPKGNKDNLVPRALLIPLENDVFVCFDTELLRVAGIWQGDSITPEMLALLSYEVPLRKKGGGQSKLPTPKGKIIAATGLYPGWQRQGEDSFEDPRPKGLDENELGRGPLTPEFGEWLGAEDAGDSVILHYTLFGGEVEEHYQLKSVYGKQVVVRSIHTSGVDEVLNLVVSDAGIGTMDRLRIKTLDCRYGDLTTAVAYPISGDAEKSFSIKPYDFSQARKTKKHWPKSIATEMQLGKPQGSYAVDELRFPYPNPWGRRIRPYGIDFFPNGDAVVVTFDGDVYRISNLGKDDNSVGWTRIAAGFDEPCSIRIRDGELFVFSRLGITQLIDKNGDGETDFYKMFCNRFTQSAETRDFAHSLTPWENGSWIICKGGQQNDFPTPHSGRVLQISSDGKEVDYWAYGLRNGFLNSIPEKGLLVASDQQGNWVPSTPFHIVRKGSFLGYEPGGPTEKTEVQPPALWFPHRIAQSGIDPVWANDPRLGALYQSILYIEYKKPSLHKIFIPKEGDIIQTAAVPLDLEFEVPLLKGAINPSDGMLYMVGFQIWDSFAKRLEGLCRLRVIKQTDNYPTSAEVFKEGVLLSFSKELDEKTALNPANYQANSWEYLRQASYGSAQYKADGNPGADKRFVHSALLSKDRKSVFLAIDNMTTTMQLEVQHYLFGNWKPVYFTINELNKVMLREKGFGAVNFQQLFASAPTPRVVTEQKAIVSEARGQELATLYGCVGCHSTDGTTEGKSGPTWRGVYKSNRVLADGSKVKATEEYLRESILEPTKVILPGFDGAEAGMPPYKGILSDEDVESLILFIRSLQ